MMMIYKIPFLKIELVVSLPKSKYPRSINVLVREMNTNNNLLVFILDERENSLVEKNFDFDVPVSTSTLIPKDIFNKILIKFNELKNSDFRYGKEDSDITDCVKKIYIEDFVNYLITENRDRLINKILNDK